MRKLFGLLFCLIALSSSAQLNLGITAGYDMAQFAVSGGSSQYYSLSAIDGFHAGLIADNKISKNFSLSGELEFAHKGSIVDKTSLALTGSSYTMKLNYLQLPVTLNYKPVLSKTSKLILDGGLYVAVGLSGKQNGTDVSTNGAVTDIDNKVDFTSDASNTNINSIKPVDWGYTFAAGIEWKKYQFKLNYMHSFDNIRPNGNTKFANETYGLSVAYLLPW